MPTSLRCDEIDRRLLCPECGGMLYASILVWSSSAAAYRSKDEYEKLYHTPFGWVYADDWDAKHGTSDLEALECHQCDWKWVRGPRQETGGTHTFTIEHKAWELYRTQSERISKLAEAGEDTDLNAMVDADIERSVIEEELAADFLALLGV